MTKLTLNLPENKIIFPMMRNAITVGFEYYTVFGSKSMHYANDISMTQPKGYNVFSTLNGTVLQSFYDSAGGNMIVIRGTYNDYFDLLTRDAHLSSRNVNASETVTIGQKIGVQGNTGSQTTQQHLHHECWLIPKNIAYSYNDRSKYTYDPIGICILAGDQDGYNGGFNHTDVSMHYFNYMKNGQVPAINAEVITGTLKIISAPSTANNQPDGRYDYNDQTMRIYPDAKYSPIVSGMGRSKYLLSHFFTEKEFSLAYKYSNANKIWWGINTTYGVVWVPDSSTIKVELQEDIDPSPNPSKPELIDKISVIDISEFQSNVDYNKLKSSGVKGVILRCSWTGYGSALKVNADKEFEKHYNGCISAGLPMGVYHYSCATTIEKAIEEAKFTLNQIRGKKIDYPVYFDTEDSHNVNESGVNKENQVIVGKIKLTEIAKAFCETIESAGYKAGIYAGLSWWNNQLDEDKINTFGYEKWLAHYTDYSHPEYKGRFGMWQYSSNGSVSGISGNVDMNYCYTDYISEPNIPDNPDDPPFEPDNSDVKELLSQIDNLISLNKELQTQNNNMSQLIQTMDSDLKLILNVSKKYE